MIRSVLALFLFAVALCALIIIDPGDGPARSEPLMGAASVSRAPSQPLLETTERQAQPQPAMAAFQGPLLPREALAPTKQLEAAPSKSVQTDSTTILQTTSSVLAGLGLDVPETPAAETTHDMANMTNDVLASIGSVTGRPSPLTAEPETALERLVIAALKEGQSDDDIDRMVNAAALAGQLTVPKVLVTEDGRVDTHVLLKAIVIQATIASGGPAPSVPDVPSGDGSGVEVRVVQRAAETQRYRFYTVNRGDSLGAIAVKFYGDVSGYQAIFEANRGILSSPNEIETGQRLVIPDLDQV